MGVERTGYLDVSVRPAPVAGPVRCPARAALDPASSPASDPLLAASWAALPLAVPVVADLVASPAGLVLQGGVFVTLLALSALFSGSEVALFSLSAGERETLTEDGSPAAKRVLALLDRPRRLLAAILLLNTVVNVGAAILSARLMTVAAGAFGWSVTATLIANVFALTFVLLVVSEIAPKLIASRQPVRFALGIAGPIGLLVRLVAPLADVLARVASALQSRVKTTEETLSSDDIKTMADVGEAQGSLEEDERALIHSIVEFGATTVREVMVSRVDMLALPASATLDEALTLIRESGHSRYPLYRESLDHVLGVVYAKDLLPSLRDGDVPGALLAEGMPTPDWEVLARKPLFVPPAKPLDDMLADFQRTNTHLAIVVDEYGGTDGLVTLEDLLEEVVGEIRDELDDVEDETLIRPLPDDGPDVWHALARIDLDDLAQTVGVPMETDGFDFETLGGLILYLLGRVPEPGDEVTFERLHFRVDGVDENRITDVRVAVRPEPEPDEA